MKRRWPAVGLRLSLAAGRFFHCESISIANVNNQNTGGTEMGRRKANVVTLEVPEEPIEETPVETPMEEHHASVASEATEETPLPAETAEADLDLAAEGAAEAAEAAAEAMEILGQIEEATRNVDNAAMLMEQAKKALKFRKEVYEDHVENLKRLCRIRMEKHPLFDGPASDQNDSPSEPEAGDGEPSPDPSPDKDAWKQLPLSDLGLPAGLIGNLEEADITTIGELCDNMNADPLSWHEDITGVGPAAIGTIADKFIDFWRDHPECQEYVEDWEVDEDESDDDEDSDDDESNDDDE